MPRDRTPVYSLMVREMLPDERPRERLRTFGEQSLNTSELLAIILNTGMKGESVVSMATRLLHEHGGLHGLYRLSFDELASTKGIGESKACKIKASLELGRRLSAAAPEERVAIEGPEDVVRLMGVEMASLEQEQLCPVLLDTRHRVIRHRMVYTGSVNSAQVRVGELFRDAVRANATAVIFAHNHPSGDPTPSAADVELTADVVKSGKLLDIAVLDHVIIGQGRWVSMKRLGLGFAID
ncbi:MAG: DNA repair protein RadC [Chloroflexota bacterium]|nr:DNA repair protein RadC [Chloroflexota bacterium]